MRCYLPALVFSLLACSASLRAEESVRMAELDSALKINFEREFGVKDCSVHKTDCTVRALALPSEAAATEAACIKSVFPDVFYERDGHFALGIQLDVVAKVSSFVSASVNNDSETLPAPVGDSPFKRKIIGKYKVITIVPKSGLQDVCLQKRVKMPGALVEISIVDPVKSQQIGTNWGSSVLSGMTNSGLSKKINQVSAELMKKLLGDASGGVVRVSVLSNVSKQTVKVGDQVLGETEIKNIGMPMSSLKKLKIGQPKAKDVLSVCQTFVSSSEYQFRC